MRKVRPLSTKTSQAYEYVKRRILDGSYAPGYRLVLDNIAREADTSQLPVREALRRLEAEGYVTYRHNAGASVAELDPDSYESTQAAIAVLEGAATADAAPFLTAEVLSKAVDLNNEMRRRRELFDAEGFIDLNAQFHDLLCSRCPNVHLLELLEGERSRMARIRQPTLGIVMRHSAEFVADHDRLLEMLRTNPRSPDIQLLAQAHKRRILEAVHTEAVTPHAPPREPAELADIDASTP
ncbi:GntR family transcriptional regulator [Arthrobacter globiformis]|uniref:GntR family transcriptional regulator n=1 Tax=Arthrobacter globiformis TaxID=1665 RepID=UPI0027862FA5|nr:GntR family transcriptional regulator [Arthrobacter globiformis]MDQ0867324.1 DNA-binding GntR family transcriptional regulator [Arthrobacter globiformis]